MRHPVYTRLDYNPIIAAVDVPTLEDAALLIGQLQGHVGFFKIGLQLIMHAAMRSDAGLRSLFETFPSARFMLDAKLHDIPATMKKAVDAATASYEGKDAPFFGVTAHLSAGERAINELELHAINNRGVSVIGVSVLTSLDEEQCKIVYSEGPRAQVNRLLAHDTRIGYVVCSPEEIPLVLERRTPATEWSDYGTWIITPGVRPLWAEKNDQARVMTPREAIHAGAHYLVIGRPITNPPDGMTPAEAADRILKELEG